MVARSEESQGYQGKRSLNGVTLKDNSRRNFCLNNIMKKELKNFTN